MTITFANLTDLETYLTNDRLDFSDNDVDSLFANLTTVADAADFMRGE